MKLMLALVLILLALSVAWWIFQPTSEAPDPFTEERVTHLQFVVPDDAVEGFTPVLQIYNHQTKVVVTCSLPCDFPSVTGVTYTAILLSPGFSWALTMTHKVEGWAHIPVRPIRQIAPSNS